MRKLDKVIEFVIRERGEYKKNLSSQTTLEKDLRITGDDSDEFILKFGKEFNIDVSQIDLEKYFANEGSFTLLKLILFGIETGKIAITLGDLEKAIYSGKLI